MAADIVESKSYASAEDFLHALSPFDSFWQTTGPQDCWIFRGVDDADAELQAKAFRKGSLVAYGPGIAADFSVEREHDRRTLETMLVDHFTKECIRAGLPIPEDGQWLRNARLQRAAFGSEIESSKHSGVDFPFPLFRSVYALAQHYGVPTRLLDWTRDPYIAAYFACRYVAREITRGETNATRTSSDLCVWALRSDIVGGEYGGCDPTIELVDAPAESNPNLKAQKGIFTLVTHKTPKGDAESALPDLVTVLHDAERERHGTDLKYHASWPLLRKHTLPHSRARVLLRLLADTRVTAATIEPTYEGAAKAMQECQYWP